MDETNRLAAAEFDLNRGTARPVQTSRMARIQFPEWVYFVRAHWRSLLLMAVVSTVYAPMLLGLMKDWLQLPDYSHGFFVPLLSGYLVWRKRAELADVPPKPTVHGLFLVLGSLGLLFLGSLGAELFLTRIAFVGTITGLILYFLGWPALRVVAFPVAFLLFMIPLPVLLYNELVFPLQLLASQSATAVLDALDLFPVVREGNILILPHYRLEVVEACSGIRSLMSLIALAFGYGYLAESNRWVRTLLVVVMLPVAVASNAFRVVGTALATYYWGPKFADGFLHSFSGWMIFISSTTLLLLLHGCINFARRRKGVPVP